MSYSVLIAGGFGALGSVLAEAFHAEGYRVARLGRSPDATSARTDMLDITGVDLTDSDSVASAVARVVGEYGGLNVVVNAAGAFAIEPVMDGKLSTWIDMFNGNLLSEVNLIQQALPALRTAEYGRIINVSAEAAIKPGKGLAAYAAAKSGVLRLTEVLAEELADSSVTVNAVLPRLIDTPANRKAIPGDTSKWVKPQALSDVILFLASQHSRALNGALIPVVRGTEA